MKKIVSLLLVSVFAVTLIGCEKVEKGTKGIKESKELQEKINKDIQNTQKTSREMSGEEENKPSDKEK